MKWLASGKANGVTSVEETNAYHDGLIAAFEAVFSADSLTSEAFNHGHLAELQYQYEENLVAWLEITRAHEENVLLLFYEDILACVPLMPLSRSLSVVQFQ